MPKQKCLKNQDKGKLATLPLSFFACPNSDCADFNHFDADNLSIAEWMGKDKAIRRLYCKTCAPMQMPLKGEKSWAVMEEVYRND